MPQYLQVEGNTALVRDTTTNAVLNVNKADYESYKQTQRSLLTKDQEINNLKSDIAEIKALLNQLLETR